VAGGAFLWDDGALRTEDEPMTETPQQPAEEPTAPAGGPDQSYEWSGADTTSGAPDEGADAGSRTSGRVWLDQLQSMIDDLATQAAPVVRQIGVKAAELAVLAGEKAGPIAHRAADATETAGIRLAERSRQLADDLRRQQGEAGAAEGEPGAAPESGPTPEPAAGTADESDGA
jgi:peptide deformylase